MVEFVKANPVLYAKEQEGHSVGRDRGAGWIVRARCQTLVPESTHEVRQGHFNPEEVRLRQELPDD